MSYKAFISYSHAVDGRLAPAVQQALHRFAKPWYRNRALRVFRDKTSLSASPALWPSIERALADSEFFLLFACPESAASKWVRMEIEWWLEHRSPEQMLILLTGGELAWDASAGSLDASRTTAIDAGLAAHFHVEPLFVDLRWAQAEKNWSLREVRFRSAILDIAAPLHGRPKDELDGEDVRQHRRTRLISAVAITSVLFGFATAVWQAVEARRAQAEAETQRTEAVAQRGIAEQRQKEAETQRAEALRQRDLAVAKSLYSEAVRLSPADGSRELSLLLAIESLKRVAEPATFGLFSTLFRQAVEVTGIIRLQSADPVSAFNADARLIAFVTEHQYLRVFETHGGREVWHARLGTLTDPQGVDSDGLGRMKFLRVTPDGARLLAVAGNHVWLFDLAGGRLLAQAAFPSPAGALHFRFSAGERLLVRSHGSQADVLDARTLRQIATVEDENGSVELIAVSADGRWAAYGFAPRDYVATQKPILVDLKAATRRTLEIDHILHEIAFSPDGRFVAFDGPKDVTGKESVPVDLPAVFDTLTGKPQPDMAPASLAWFDPDRSFRIDRSAASIRDRRPSMYRGDFETTTAVTPGQIPVPFVWTDDGEYAASAVDGKVHVLETSLGRRLAITAFTGNIGVSPSRTMTISPTGQYGAAFDEEGAVVFRAIRGTPLTVLPGFERPLRIVTGRSGLLAAEYQGSGGEGYVLFQKNGRTVARVTDCAENFVANADASRIGVGCENATVRVVDVSGKVTAVSRRDVKPSGTFEVADDFSLSGNGDVVLTSTREGKHLLFNASTGQIVRSFGSLHFYNPMLSPDGSYLLSYGVGDGPVLHSMTSDSEPKLLIKVEPESAAFSDDGTKLAVTDGSRSAYVLAIPSGDVLAKFDHKSEEQDAPGIVRIVFGESGNKLATLSQPRAGGEFGVMTLNVFDIPTKRHVLQIALPDRARGLYFTAAEDAVEVVFGTRRLWAERFSLDAAAWIREACARLPRNMSTAEWASYLPGIPYTRSCETLNPITSALIPVSETR